MRTRSQTKRRKSMMQQQQPKPTGSTATSLLLDAPEPWLMQLISGQYLDSDSKLSLFQTSKKLNHMVMQNSPSTCLKVDPLVRPLNRITNMLQTANRHARNIRLYLYPTHNSPLGWEDEPTFRKQAMRVVINILQEAAEQGATNAATELELTDVWLQTILPPAIGQACHNLRKLSLCGTIQFDKKLSFSNHFKNLQALELHECNCEQLTNLQPGSMPDTDKQGLTALRSLTILPWKDNTVANVINIISHAAPLTQLCYLGDGGQDDDDSVEYNLRVVDWVQLGATLQHLRLPAMRAGDEAMEIFLKMPCLTHVLVMEFELDRSYEGRPCKWEELVIEWKVNVQTLAYLPLHPGLLLKLGDVQDDCDFPMDKDQSHLFPQAVANVRRAKALEWVHGLTLLSPYGMEASEIAEWLQQALPLIKDVTHLAIENGHLDEAVMQRLVDIVRGREDKPCIEFTSSTQWAIGDMMALVMRMPHDSSIIAFVEGPDYEEQLIQLCSAVQRKFTLHACYEDKQDISEQQITSAIHAWGLEVTVLSSNCQHDRRVTATVQPRHDSL